tara:strand:+ start:563 stop:1849 length:1287 start_codon:yes stop_codon:yes gene_type:complete
MNKLLFKNFYQTIAILLPFSIIAGPAIADISIVILGLFYILICIKDKDFRGLTNTFSLVFFIFCIFLIIISFLSQNPLLSLESSLFYFRFGLFALSINYLLNNNLNFSKYFFYSIILCFILLSLDSIIELTFNKNFISIFTQNYVKSYGRVSSLFYDEYILGSYFVRLLPIACALSIVLIKNKFQNILLIFIISISSFIIFISGERTALAMLIIFLLSTFFIFNKLKKLFFVSLLIFFLTSVIAILVSPQLKQRVFNDTTNQINFDFKNFEINLFSVQHQVIYKTSYKIIKENFFFGIGPKMFREICKNKKYKTYTELDKSIDGCQTHSHNNYIQVLTETGIFGLFFFILIYILICYQLFLKFLNSKKNFNDYEIIEIFCLLSFFINLWPIMPTGSMFNNWINIMYFLPVGFYLYSKKKQTNLLNTYK